MYIAELFFKKTDGSMKEDVDREDELHSFLGALVHNGQILSNYFPIVQKEAGYTAFVLIPDKNALDTKYGNQWVRESYDKFLNAAWMNPEIKILGFDASSSEVCACAKPKSFILFTHFLTVESPLKCGDCFCPVPIYLIPEAPDGSSSDIRSWQADYRACDTLQIGSSTGERFGTREMSKVDSSLSKRGRAICDAITKSTGIRTYYYLFCYNGKSDELERERKCPSCYQEWLLEEPLHKIFDFRCIKCRLLSNIAWDVREY